MAKTPEKEIDEAPAAPETLYAFPEHGISITAESSEDAEQKLSSLISNL